MNIFATPEWEPNAVADKSSKDLFQLGKINQKKLKRIKKKQKHNGRLLKEASKQRSDGNLQTDGSYMKDHMKKYKNLNPKKQKLTNSSLLHGKREKKKKENQDEIKQTLLPIKNQTNKMVKLGNKIKIKKSNNILPQNESKKIQNSKNKINPDKNLIKEGVAKSNISNSRASKFKEKFMKLQLGNHNSFISHKKLKSLPLRQRMMERLKASRFRFLNENMYTSTGKEAQQYFQKDPESFKAYHEGYKQQVSLWPLNPLDIIIKSIKKLPLNFVIGDFGCGEARLAQSVKCKVHSFDFVAINEHVTACNMANVPLENESINVAVFCLSLMGNNLKDYIIEANRVLKIGGILKIADVESRFDNVEVFIKDLQKFGFVTTWKDFSHNLFYFMDFKKTNNCNNKSKLPIISLQPCLYKKR